MYLLICIIDGNIAIPLLLGLIVQDLVFIVWEKSEAVPTGSQGSLVSFGGGGGKSVEN